MCGFNIDYKIPNIQGEKELRPVKEIINDIGVLRSTYCRIHDCSTEVKKDLNKILKIWACPLCLDKKLKDEGNK